MQKRAPTLANILVIVLFALSCFGLLLFLWESFGGSVPLKPKSYRFSVAFPRTLALSEQSDVRISGVNVGHVISTGLGKDGRTHATIELASRYAPIRSNVHAILRQKTLLGETYVQLEPQSSTAPPLPENGQLPISQVEPSVTLDDILSALDPTTRRAFQVWMQSLATGFNGRGEDINAFFATLDPFVRDTNRLVGILATQEGALRAVVHNTGVVFDALTERQGQLRGLTENGERTFHAAAEGSQAFADAFRALPTFERNSTVALRSLDSFATDASPLLDQLRPAQRQLASLLAAVKPFAPEFNGLLTAFGPLVKASKRGLPFVKKGLDLTVPLLGAGSPVLRNLDPFFQYASQYVPELQALFANIAAATEAHGNNTNDQPPAPQEHFLRAMQVIAPEGLAAYSHRIGTNRSNPYPQPGAFRALLSGLQVFSNGSCANSAPSVSGPPSEGVSQAIIEQLIGLNVANAPESATNAVPAPPCNQQGSFTFNGQTSQFPHVAAK